MWVDWSSKVLLPWSCSPSLARIVCSYASWLCLSGVQNCPSSTNTFHGDVFFFFPALHRGFGQSFQNHLAYFPGASRSGPLLIDSPQPMQGVSLPAVQGTIPSPVAGGFPDPPLATSHQQERARCPKGKAKISYSSGPTEPVLDSRSMGVSSPLFPPGFGPPTYGFSPLAMGPSFTGPTLHGPTT